MKIFYKQINSVARSIFSNIYNIYWDTKASKVKIKDLLDEFPLFTFAEMYYDFLKGEYEFDNSVELPSSKNDKLNVVIDAIKRGNCYIYYDQNDKSVKGFIQYVIWDDINLGHIETLFTDKNSRHQHIGTSLIEFIERLVRNKHNISQMSIHCQSKNDIGQKFYKVMGYKEISKEEYNKLGDVKQSKESYDFSMETIQTRMKKYKYNNKRKVTGRRRFKCMDCGQRFGEFNQLKLHAERYHKDLIQGEDIYKYLYEKRNPGPYICTICRKRPRVWNEKNHKYSRICDNPECAKKAREIFSKNMKKVYGTDNLAQDPEYQAMLLANRSITKTFMFPDGGKINCVGEYELDLLNYLVKNHNYTSVDIVECPASLYVKYMDVYTKKERYYIPDFFIPKYDLVIEVKDGSKYPIDSKAKAALKEQAVIKLDKFNYIKIVDKNYSDFESFVESFEENHFSDDKRDTEHIFIIPETKDLL